MRILKMMVFLALAAAPALEAQVRRPLPPPPAPSSGWLGVTLERQRVRQGEEATERLLVGSVAPGSPAERAGLRTGDAVVRWNGRTDVVAALTDARLEPGDTVDLRIRREGARDRNVALVAAGRPAELSRLPFPDRGEDVVVFRRMPAAGLRVFPDSLVLRADSLHSRLRAMLEDSLRPRLRVFERVQAPMRLRLGEENDAMLRALEERGFAFEEGFGMRAVAGAEFSELNPGLGSYFGTERGVLVLRVAPDTPAARAGLAAGDVVVEVDGTAVEGVRQLRRAVAGAEGREVRLEVIRKGERRAIPLRWN